MPSAKSPDELPAIRLAGLTFRIEAPLPPVYPPSWRPFLIPPVSARETDLSLCLNHAPCPVKPGPRLNSSPYFEVCRPEAGSGLLGRPVGAFAGTAWWRPEVRRLDLFVGEGGLPPETSWVEPLLWRFRLFILALHDRAVFHACAAMRAGRVFLFTGDSGQGKSTLAALLAAAGWTVLSDESPMGGPDASGGWTVWGSPWPSSAGFAAAGEGRLAGLFFLAHGPENRLDSMTPGEAAKRLLAERLVLCPFYEDAVRDRLLDLTDRVVRERPCRRLTFRPDASVAAFLARL